MKKKFKFIKIRYILFLLLCMSASIICGCGETDLKSFFDGTLISAIKTRADLNKELAVNFKNIGAISESDLAKITAQKLVQMELTYHIAIIQNYIII